MSFEAVLSPPVRLHQLLFAWQTDPLDLASVGILVLVAVAYLWGVRRQTQRGRHWPAARTASFLGGLLLVVVAVDSGVASYDDSVFFMHVIQHLLLMSAAPPLLALGAPMTLWLQAMPRRGKSVLLAVLHSKIVSFLTHPAVAFTVGMGTMYLYFLTPLYAISERHPLFHDYTHLHFLLAGCLYWWPIVGLDPMPRRLSYPARLAMLGLAIPFNAFLGVAIMNMSHSIDPAIHTLSDTHTGGAILWGFGELFTILGLAAVFVQWAGAEERLARRADRAASRPRAERASRTSEDGSAVVSLARAQALARRAVLLPDPQRQKDQAP